MRFLQAAIAALILLILLAAGCSMPAETFASLAWNGETFQLLDGPKETGTAIASKTSLITDEKVIEFRQAGAKLFAYDGDKQIWETEPDLTVDNFLVADPDNDGAEEVIFSLWKADDSGKSGSEIWIYGYGDGRLRAEWCGSAVADPIRQFTVLDVDEDGAQELVVLEGSYEESRRSPAHSITIWRWNGWGFTNIWRSAAGEYVESKMYDSISGDSPVIQIEYRR